MKKQLLILFVLTIITSISFAQNTGIGTATPDTSSKLEVASTTQGFLLPRMTEVQRDAIVTPAEGLCVYNLTSDCLNYYDGTIWKELCGI